MDKMSSAVVALAEKHIGEFTLRNGELKAEYCPFCHGGDNGDKYTFGIGLYNGAYSCFRGNCGVKGSFKQLCNHFGEIPDEDLAMPTLIATGAKQQKTYDRPDPEKLLPVTEEIITYFLTRRISEDTIKAFHIAADENGNIVFPFYRDGELIFEKYRKPKKFVKGNGPKEWGFKNGEQILFGMDNVSLNKTLIITEGQLDAMSLYEAGQTNVVSVPSGCNGMDWVTLCWDWLENFNQIILFGDSDEPGIQMMQTLTRRLGEDRCMMAPQYPELVVNGEHKNRPCKDANEILYCYGPEVLSKLVDSCEPAPVHGILNLSDVKLVDPSSVDRIYTRIPMLDQTIGGFTAGSLVVISGRRGEGKSTISGEFLLQAIQQGKNVAAYSGELPAHRFLQWIMAQATERKYLEVKTDSRNGKHYAMVPKDIEGRIRKWLDGHFFLFDNTTVEQGTLIDSLIKRFKICSRRYGCSLFLVDNLMMLSSGMEDEYKMQAKITAALKQFAVSNDATVILVAHPRKTPAGQAFNSEDISGSAAISNLADIVMSIEKPDIRVTKNREFGDTCFINCSFDPASRRIFQTSTGDRTMFGWDHKGIAEPENPACELEEFAITTSDGNPF